MKIKVAKRDLETALKVVSNTVAMGGSDISAHYLFRKTERGVEVLSYNGRVFSSCPISAQSEGEGDSFTVEAKRIRFLLDAVAEDAVLEMSCNGTETQVSTGRGKNTFASLDPSLFPFWDEVLDQSKKTAQVAADRLNAAFAHAKTFIYDQEAKAPHLCVAEFKKGCLYSTDQIAVSIIKVSGMEDSSIRVFNKDIASVISFLSTIKDKDVEVFEHDRALFFKRHDGAVFGESRYASAFPDIAVDWTIEDDHWVDIPKQDVASAVKFLASGARWDDTLLRMTINAAEKSVVFSMAAANGKPIAVEVKALEVGRKSDDVPELPSDGFPISNVYVSNLIERHSTETVRIRISRKGKGGWIRVRDERGEDTYLTTVAWLKTV